jgi:hypothetical protein
MSYRHFSLAKIKKDFSLIEQKKALFPGCIPIKPSEWLNQALEIGVELALSSSSEKARSEFIIAPILMEMERRMGKRFSIYSGERLDVDDKKGLMGECDFILAKGTMRYELQSPIFGLVEAKRNDINAGLGQCIAQMMGAYYFNAKEKNDIDTIFGCVTTGEDWQFLQLTENNIIMDTRRYYINDLENILGVFQFILNQYLE